MTTIEILTLLAILATITSPLIAIWVGGLIQKMNQQNERRLDVLRRVIAYSHELAPGAPQNTNILSALLEIKFWYHKDKEIIDIWMTFQQKLSTGLPADDELHQLLVLMSKKERIRLSRAEIIAGLKSN